MFLVGLPLFLQGQLPRLTAVALSSVGDDVPAKTFALPPAAPGDTLILIIGMTGSNTISVAPSGFTLLRNTFNGTSGTDRRAYVYTKKADGTEGASIAVTTTNSDNSSAACIALRIAGGSADAECNQTATTGSSSSPNPPSFSPSWGDQPTLWIATFCGRADNVTAFPAGYGQSIQYAPVDTPTLRVAAAFLWKHAATEDPGAFTQSASDSWAATTIAVRGL